MLDLGTIILLPACALATFVGVGLLRRVALALGVMDLPNERSSHLRAMPRGGGLAIAVVACAALAVLAALGLLPSRLALALLVPGAVVAAVGLLDDVTGLSAVLRFMVQLVAASAALFFLDGWGPDWIARGSGPWWLLQGATVIGIVWSINLYNFMDGIDGIAGSEAACLGFGGMLLLSGQPSTHGIAIACGVLAACSLGFLAWNWPPARIFLGDVGSGFLGLAFAVVAVASACDDPALLSTWLILAASFLADSGATLVRRLARGERFYQAHRMHAYQALARRWRGHAPVTLAVIAVNLLWLLPLAWLSLRHREHAAWITLVAYAPLVGAVLVAGAGGPEAGTQGR
jgi:glycosyltransferase WbpL